MSGQIEKNLRCLRGLKEGLNKANVLSTLKELNHPIAQSHPTPSQSIFEVRLKKLQRKGELMKTTNWLFSSFLEAFVRFAVKNSCGNSPNKSKYSCENYRICCGGYCSSPLNVLYLFIRLTSRDIWNLKKVLWTLWQNGYYCCKNPMTTRWQQRARETLNPILVLLTMGDRPTLKIAAMVSGYVHFVVAIVCGCLLKLLSMCAIINFGNI